MGLLDKIPGFSGTDSDADPGMTSRLDKVAKLSIEHVDIPSEFRPTDLEAWLFAPAGTRVGVLGEPQGNQQQEKIPELIDMVSDRFERLETALDLMEANIKLTQQQTAQLAAESVTAASTTTSGESADVLHTIGADGEVSSKVVATDASGQAASSQLGMPGGPSLLDLYEAQSLAVNPFLRSGEAESLLQGPMIDPTKIVALLLDHLSGADTLQFLKAASKSGVVTSAEEKILTSIASLAEPGIQSEGSPVVDNRTLLTFTALIEAWRAQGSS